MSPREPDGDEMFSQRGTSVPEKRFRRRRARSADIDTGHTPASASWKKSPAAQETQPHRRQETHIASTVEHGLNGTSLLPQVGVSRDLPSKQTTHGGRTHAHHFRDLAHRPLLLTQLVDVLGRLGTDVRLPATVPAIRASGLQASLGALYNERTLELSQRGEDLEHKITRWRCRIDWVRHGSERYSSGLEHFDSLDEMLRRAAQPVELPHDNLITRSYRGH